MGLFRARDYREVIRQKTEENKGIHGYKGRLAQAAGCQRAYLSQVLAGSVQLTPDHAAGLAQFWRLEPVERDYFLELVNLARAATPTLRRLIESRLETLKISQESVSGRIKKPKIESVQLQSRYYSAWYYSAIHILITIANFRTIGAIAKRLKLSEDTVGAALSTLEQMNLAKREKEIWLPVSFDLHLPSQSPLNSINHLNWRLRAVEDSQKQVEESVHFTAVYSMSEKDIEDLKSRILQLISNSREIALKSAEKELVSMTIDLFRP